MVDRIVNFFTSLRLTVACLCFGLVLVFIGTLAQVDEGLYNAQVRYFKAFFVWWGPAGASWTMPVFPAGYLVGTLLLVNLLSAHAKRFKWEKKRTGIIMTHFGVILLLLGQLLTDVLSRESAMRLSEGETKSYSEDFHRNELVLIDQSGADGDEVISIPETLVAQRGELRHEKLPFTLRVKEYWPNSWLASRPTNGFNSVSVSEGMGKGVFLQSRAPVTAMDSRNVPAAVVEAVADGKSIGTWLVSCQTDAEQFIRAGGREFLVAMRFERHYKPFDITLTKFSHDLYKGTDKPKNFSSDIILKHRVTGEERPVKIWMNHPLRYAGETFFQASFDKDDAHVTVLQVVKNPSWLTPYLSCVLVGAGLLVQFLTHLIGFAMKRRTV